MSEQFKSRTTEGKTPAPTDVANGKEAVFLGWQRTSGDLFPLYNIFKLGHPQYLSTVTEMTLRGLHMRIPRTPSPYPEVGPSPWHELGSDLESLATAKEVLDVAGLDYSVIKMPLKDAGVLNHHGPASERWATVRTDTGEVLGFAGESCEPIQNRDAFKFFDHLVDANEAIYETAGMLGKGGRMWILAKLPGYIRVRGNDIVGKYLLLTNSHDGSSRIQLRLTPIRVVCNNTLTAALKGVGTIQIPHTRNAEEDMKQALSVLGLSNTMYEQLDAIFNRLALTKITDKQLLDYVKALVPDNGDEAEMKNSEQIRNAILELYDSGHGATLARGTLWGAFNAVAEYVDHALEVDATARLESILSGRGEKLAARAYRIAEGMM